MKSDNSKIFRKAKLCVLEKLVELYKSTKLCSMACISPIVQLHWPAALSYSC
jgi:hypothetical protein